MVPPRVAQKMSVVSVESMAFLAPGPKAAERAQPPGSGRPGGVEATGASLGTVPSWPDRPRGRGAPVGGLAAVQLAHIASAPKGTFCATL